MMKACFKGLAYYTVGLMFWGSVNTLSDDQDGVLFSRYSDATSFDFFADLEFDSKAKEVYLNDRLVMSSRDIKEGSGYFHKYEAFRSDGYSIERAERGGFPMGSSYVYLTRDKYSSKQFHAWDIWMPITLPIFIYRAITE